MKIAIAFFCVYICNVTYPQAVGSCGYVIPYKILVLMESMIGVRRVTRPRTLKHETVCAHYVEEGIPAGQTPVGIYLAYHKPELVASYAGSHLAYLVDCVQHGTKAFYIVMLIAHTLIIGLPRMAKQSAGDVYFEVFTPA